MKKEKCPALGKVCNKCGTINNFESKNFTRFQKKNHQDLVAIHRTAENSTIDTPIKVGLTLWMNRPPLTTLTETGATVSPHLTRNQ